MMSVILPPLGESEIGDVAFEAGTTSDSDIDEERHELVAMPRALQRVSTPDFLKRTYGVPPYDSCSGRRSKCAKLDQQLDGLRAVVPHSKRRRERNDSLVLDAYDYIATLQKQVEDLSTELLEDEASLAQTHDEECEARALSHHRGLDHQPLDVDIMKKDGVLEVRIVCANRPGLLVDVMEAVESRGLTVTCAKIACYSDLVFKYLSLENEETVTEEGVEGDAEEELDRIKAMLVNAICGSDMQ